jgi:hypothetical protein
VANTLLTPVMITNKAVIVLENETKAIGLVSSEYSDQFAKNGAKIGATVNVRKPPRYVGRQGAGLSVEDQNDSQVPLVLTTQFGVDVQFTSQELTLSLDDFAARVLKPQMAVIANRVDRDLLLLYQSVPNLVGTPGTPPAALSSLMAVRQRLLEMAAPDDNQMSLIIGPAAQTSLVNGLGALFNAQEALASQYKQGALKIVAGLDIYQDQNVVTQTVGPLGGSPTVSGASQGLTSGWAYSMNLVTNGWTAAAAKRLSAGDVFTIANVFSVNPQNRQSTGVLQQFVVQADTASDASGNATVPVIPCIISGGQFQNVTISPPNAAVITVSGTASTGYSQNLGFHKSAFTIAFADLILPRGVDMAERRQYRSISLRVIRAYDINSDRFPSRTDVLYGTKAVYPELGCRLTN